MFYETVGIKSGSYCLWHPGHVFALNECKKRCDYLIALINDDEYVMRKKHCVPIDAAGREAIVANHRAVDETHIFSGANEHKWIMDFKVNPHIDYGELVVFHSDELGSNTWVPGHTIADKIIFIPKLHSPIQISTSQIFDAIRSAV